MKLVRLPAAVAADDVPLSVLVRCPHLTRVTVPIVFVGRRVDRYGRPRQMARRSKKFTARPCPRRGRE